MNNDQKGPNLTLFAVFTTITIFVWIGAEAYQIFHKRNLENIPTTVIAPLSPVLDTAVLGDIEKKQFFQIEASASPTPETVGTSSAQPKSP